MSGVNDDYYVHYYIQQQKKLSCLIRDILSTPAPEVDSPQLTQGGSRVRRSCQSTIVGRACAFEKGDFKRDFKKNTLGGFLSI